MLAPLKDRSILERTPDSEESELARQNIDLRGALRRERSARKKAALHMAGEVARLQNEIHRLDELRQYLQHRLDALENGTTMMQMAQELMALRTRNDQLNDALQALWRLDRNLEAAQEECVRLAGERDAALARLALSRH